MSKEQPTRLELDSEQLELLENGLRMAVRQCRENELELQRELAYQQVYGTPERAGEQRELLDLSQEATAAYMRLLTVVQGH